MKDKVAVFMKDWKERYEESKDYQNLECGRGENNRSFVGKYMLSISYFFFST